MPVGSTTVSGYSGTAPAEFVTVLTRREYAKDGTKYPVVFGHGFGGKAGDICPGVGNFAVPTVLAWLAQCGWPVFFPDLGGDQWGNTTGQSRFADCVSYAVSAWGAKSGGVIAAGYSQGGLNALAYTRANPSTVKALFAFNPACNLQDGVTNNRDGAAASINAAFTGGAYSEVRDGPTSSPVDFASQLAGIPTLICHATDDTLALPQYTSQVIAAIGSVTERTGTGGHGETFLATIDSYGVSSWLTAQGV
jgi:pimeloyl-ACP methyl ester carboxylesterase